ncbi:UDP-N-acetylmuramoyl-L-alanyl-D-glutamate--2,6-diaminopimelate ligase [Parahaliea mediterranea]|nr:UDP-N-acetylmuramoyl-L-alanyl-D-glutamate--2,6-diaminopimelate ligase [Parahaliea mediterranea]
MMAQVTTDAGMPLSALLDMPLADDVRVSGLALDSRQVRPGDLFLALAGSVHDGRAFMEQAVASGAAAVVAEAPAGGFVDALPVPLIEIPELSHEAGVIAARFHGDPTRTMRVVGVTGTNGKTTTSRLVAQLQRALERPCGVIGTLGAALDDSVTAAANTTPDPVVLQRQLAEWLRGGVRDVAMEVSSHALVQGRVNGVRIDTAVFTNLSRDHLDYHGSMAAYARAKMGLFTREGLRFGVINSDDAYAGPLRALAAGHCEVLGYSASGDARADIRVSELVFDQRLARGRIDTPWGHGELRSSLPGDFNVANLAAAITCAVLGGHDLDRVLAAVPALQPVPGRLQAIPNSLGIQVLVDYAHTPDALEQVLRAIRPQVAGALVTVFGCGGDRDTGKRPLMGRVACQGSDRVIVTSDNPRGEDPGAILADIAAGCSGEYSLETDRAAAIAQAIDEAAPGDCVLIAGKGHEDYQIVEGQRLYFSDAEQARAALARRAGS